MEVKLTSISFSIYNSNKSWNYNVFAKERGCFRYSLKRVLYYGIMVKDRPRTFTRLSKPC